MRSRQDLQRINNWMGNKRIMARTLSDAFPGTGPTRIAELGGGDGTFLLHVARRLAPGSERVEALLLDKASIVRPETHRQFQNLGWHLETQQVDIFDWLEQPATQCWDVILANLFLHHFSEAQLAGLFRLCSHRTNTFVAVEPRRWAWSLFFGRWLWMLGCNAVTRHDAIVSIRAGFRGRELAGLWPVSGDWVLEERPANLASHLFIAKRRAHALKPAEPCRETKVIPAGREH